MVDCVAISLLQVHGGRSSNIMQESKYFRVHFSETNGASQYFVQHTEEELKHLNVPVQALHDFEKCSESLTSNQTVVLDSCHFAMLSHRCQPQYLLAVLCAHKPTQSTSVRPSTTAPTVTKTSAIVREQSLPPLHVSSESTLETLPTTGPPMTTKELESKLTLICNF